ncbi:MAG TPA: GAF domain-containing protein, partial [Allocoleopsis sp.]
MKNLQNNEIVTAQTVNLTNCDREQIHIPGSIQPHGVLIVLDKESLKIIQVSYNSQNFLGYTHSELITKSLTELLGEAQSQLIESCLNKDFNTINPVKLSLNQLFFNGIIHAINNYIILELEPIDSLDKNDFFNFYQMTKGIITQIQYTANLNELCQVIVTKIRELTGFDRVMIYRFDQDLSGNIIAENKRDDLESFLGLHYPATDIPQPARKLYLLNLIRLIPDVDYQEIALPNHPETNEFFDLSFAVLRSVSPIHLEYLTNMGVKASMSISLI